MPAIRVARLPQRGRDLPLLCDTKPEKPTGERAIDANSADCLKVRPNHATRRSSPRPYGLIAFSTVPDHDGLALTFPKVPPKFDIPLRLDAHETHHYLSGVRS